jgi:3-oxoadipate enol-lactonase
MPLVDRGTHRLHYDIEGRPDAPPLLLIMGMGFSSRAWHTFPSALAERFRVVAYDNCGAGRSTVPGSLWRTRDMADDAAAVLDAAGAPSAYVFGLSMGGLVAQELVLRHPARVRALALGGTFAGHLRAKKPNLRTTYDFFVAVARGRRIPPARVADLLVTREHFASDPAAFRSWLRETENVKPSIAARQIAAVMLHDTSSRLRRIAVPTLVITGERDRLVPPANSRRLAALIPGARLVVMPRAGHVFPVERPAETADELARFFLGAQSA